MKNRKIKIVTTLIVLLPVLVGLVMWNRLPQELPTHWGFGDDPNGWSSKAFAVFGLPLITLAAHWLCIWGVGRDKQNHGHNEKVLNLVLWVFPVVSVTAMLVIYGTALGMEWDVSAWMTLLLGLLFVSMGNYLPKCKQNSTLGIKLKWTLYSEENWNKTHRFSGKVWVGCGVAFMLAVFLPESALYWLLPLMVLVLVGAPTVYSYRLYRRQVREGRWTQSAASKGYAASSSKWNRIGLAVTAMILALVAVLMVAGSIRPVCGDTELTVEASFWEDARIPYDRIDRVEYRPEGVGGTREWGFGSARLLMGTFENEEFGLYLRYTYTGGGPCVVVYVGSDVVVLGCETEEQTLALYQDLCQRIG